MRFKFRAGQIGHSVANGLPRCDISSKRGVLYLVAMTRRWTLCRNTGSTMKEKSMFHFDSYHKICL